ncbi:DUF427 domain-containing protein [Mycobacterium uberis]|uniref:DUF427 domain-containing protein n=1 Tax=Mycobacterium uberis TaxID=2162698 RepID=UPI001FB47AD4|nr:DUF427 domain-containing protein [Mycobacterium uberis]
MVSWSGTRPRRWYYGRVTSFGVQYISLGYIAQHRLSHTDTSTCCLFKSDVSYYRMTTVVDDIVDDAIWTYEIRIR